jgi:hypothetical protein
VIPLAIHDLFSQIAHASASATSVEGEGGAGTFSVKVAYLEIYNEQVGVFSFTKKHQN